MSLRLADRPPVQGLRKEMSVMAKAKRRRKLEELREREPLSRKSPNTYLGLASHSLSAPRLLNYHSVPFSLFALYNFMVTNRENEGIDWRDIPYIEPRTSYRLSLALYASPFRVLKESFLVPDIHFERRVRLEYMRTTGKYAHFFPNRHACQIGFRYILYVEHGFGWIYEALLERYFKSLYGRCESLDWNRRHRARYFAISTDLESSFRRGTLSMSLYVDPSLLKRWEHDTLREMDGFFSGTPHP